jgi:heme A synthase
MEFVPSLLARPKMALAAEAWSLSTSVEDKRADVEAQGFRDLKVPGMRFRALTVVTVCGLFILVTLGGVVRLTDSGLGCPDWPLCHGKIIPPLETSTLIEYSHRLMATVVGGLILVTVFVVWRSYRRWPWMIVPATLGLILLIVQVFLGGVTVLEELSPKIVVAHLATAEALMATMVVVCMVALFGSSLRGSKEDANGRRLPLPILALVAALAAYGLMLTGSYVAASGAAPACGQGWPLCSGQLIPEGHHPMMHMLHRLVALLVGLLIATVLALAWRHRNEKTALGWWAVMVGGLFLSQVVIGAAILWMGFPMAARLIHLSMATVVWVGLAVLAILAYSPIVFRQQGVRSAQA